MKLSTRLVSAVAGLVAIATVAFTKPADARPMPKGTFTLSAERLTGLTIEFPQNSSAVFGLNLLMAPVANSLQFPRIGGDYFIIDGLSLGGSVGLGYRSSPQEMGVWAILPRVGYAFAINQAIDFWPRLSLGVGGNMGAFGNSAFGILGLEGAFVWKATENFGVEFGPTFDVAFGNGSTVVLGANAGFVYRF